MFEDSGVLDSGRAGGFAGAASKAGIEVAHDSGIERNLAFHDGSHDIDSAPRGIGLVPGEAKRGAGIEAESASNALERFLFYATFIGGQRQYLSSMSNEQL